MEKRIYISIFLSLLFWITGKGYAMTADSILERDTLRSITLHFELNRDEIDSTSAGNRNVLAALDSLLENPSGIRSLNSLTVTSPVWPEGNAEFNTWLAAMRIEAVKDLLKRRYPYINKVDVQSERIDSWTEIRRRVAADSLVPDREDVLMLIDFHREQPEKLMSLLNRLNGKKPYRYLASHILPELNRVNIQMGFSEPMWVADAMDSVPIRIIRQELETVLTPIIRENGKKPAERRTVLAVKNNLLYDLALAPNIEIELPIGRRWSLNTEYKCPWWLNDSREFCYQLLSGGVEARCWLGNRRNRNRLTGHFLGLYAEGGTYDFQFGGDGYQGKYYGASGLSYGYSKQVARHLALEFSFGVGYLTTEYRKYTPYKGSLIWTSSGRYNFMGPTKAKVSLVWLLTTRR